MMRNAWPRGICRNAGPVFRRPTAEALRSSGANMHSENDRRMRTLRDRVGIVIVTHAAADWFGTIGRLEGTACPALAGEPIWPSDLQLHLFVIYEA